MREIIASPWFALGSNIISILVSIVITLLVSRYYSSSRTIRYQCRSFGLMFASMSRLPGLEIRYQGVGEPVDNVTVSKLVVLNAGRAVIRRGDVLGNQSLRVAIDPQYQILSAEVLQSSNPENEFQVTVARDRKTAAIRFDHIERSEGVVIQLVHTGTQSRDLKVEGKYANTPIRRAVGQRGDRGASVTPFSIAFLGFVVGVCLIILVILPFLPTPVPDSTLLGLPLGVRIAAVVAFIALFVGYVVALTRMGRLPKGFEKYEEDL